jgi:hypothetical protein
MPFEATSQTPWAIPFGLADYLELVDWTGRAMRSDKRGHIPSEYPRILDRLGIDPGRLLQEFGTAVGAPAAMVNLCARGQTKYGHGIRAARRNGQRETGPFPAGSMKARASSRLWRDTRMPCSRCRGCTKSSGATGRPSPTSRMIPLRSSMRAQG